MPPEPCENTEFTQALLGWWVSVITLHMTQTQRDQISNDIRRVEKQIRDSGPVDAPMEAVLDFGDRLQRQLAGL
jgi:hypothetical protein